MSIISKMTKEQIERVLDEHYDCKLHNDRLKQENTKLKEQLRIATTFLTEMKFGQLGFIKQPIEEIASYILQKITALNKAKKEE